MSNTFPRLHSPRRATDEGGGGHVVPDVASIAEPFRVPCAFAWPGQINSLIRVAISLNNLLS